MVRDTGPTDRKGVLAVRTGRSISVTADRRPAGEILDTPLEVGKLRSKLVHVVVGRGRLSARIRRSAR